MQFKRKMDGMCPDVNIYPMKKFWQVVNQILGLWSWLVEILNNVEFPFSLFIFKWQRKVIPAFRKMMSGEKRSYLEISENGLKYRLWPWWEIRCRWEDVKRINKGRWLGDALFLERADCIGFLEFSINLGNPKIHLSSLTGWKKGRIESDLRRYCPRLFES